MAADPSIDVDALAALVQEAVKGGMSLGEMVGVDAQDYEPIYALAHSYYVQERYDEAARLFGYLCLHNHNNARYLRAYAAAMQMDGQYAVALGLFQVLIVMEPHDPSSVFHMCECLIGLGMKEDAADGLRIVMKHIADFNPAMQARARAILDLLTSADVQAASNQKVEA